MVNMYKLVEMGLKPIFTLLIIVMMSLVPALAQNVKGAGVLKITKNNIEYEIVSMDRLMFKYQPPMDVEHPDGTVTKGSGKKMAIPKEIMALNGKKVGIKAFVLPLEGDSKVVKTFLMADAQVSCLFCAMLGYDQWLFATSVDPQGLPIKDEQLDFPITIYGTLEVGEEYQEGRLASLYRIKADTFDTQRQKIFGLF